MQSLSTGFTNLIISSLVMQTRFLAVIVFPFPATTFHPDKGKKLSFILPTPSLQHTHLKWRCAQSDHLTNPGSRGEAQALPFCMAFWLQLFVPSLYSKYNQVLISWVLSLQYPSKMAYAFFSSCDRNRELCRQLDVCTLSSQPTHRAADPEQSLLREGVPWEQWLIGVRPQTLNYNLGTFILLLPLTPSFVHSWFMAESLPKGGQREGRGKPATDKIENRKGRRYLPPEQPLTLITAACSTCLKKQQLHKLIAALVKNRRGVSWDVLTEEGWHDLLTHL